MIWSEQELARLVICKENVIIERVIRHLDEPENQEIFELQNLSLLWGILGVVGVNGLSSKSAVKIWNWLNKNNILDAFDKGVLDDFNKRLIHQFTDERMRGWINLDNFTAGLKFEKTILRPLAKLDAGIKNDVDMNFPHFDALINRIHRYGIDDRLQNYLNNIKPITSDENLFNLDVIFDKEQFLLKLAKAITYTNYHFTEPEKNFLWYYFLDAVNKGFNALRIGITDRFLAQLVSAPIADDKSELDTELLQSRNDSISDFVQELEGKDCFFEETAAKIILFNPQQISQMMDRCLSFAKNSQHPNGVVFALALINLQQIKSAIIVLRTLAQFGVVTEACGFMHRLLPQAKGGESVVLNLLKTNLQEFKKRSYLAQDEAYQEFLMRSYLQAIRAFLEVECFNEGTDLLCFIVHEGWIKEVPQLVEEFKRISNLLLGKKKNFVEQLRPAAEFLGFSVYEEGEIIFIGAAQDNPLTQTRHRLEAVIKDTTTFDVSGVFNKMASVETEAYNKLQNLKQTFKKKEQNNKIDSPTAIANLHDEIIPDAFPLATDCIISEEAPISEENLQPLDEAVLEKFSLDAEPESSASLSDDTTAEAPLPADAVQAKADDVSIENVEPAPTVTLPDLSTEKNSVTESPAEKEEVSIPDASTPSMPSLTDVEHWEQVTDNQPASNRAITQGLQNIKEKINFNNILNISAQEIDKHFEKIKQSADNALTQAKEKINHVTQKVEDAHSATPVDKLRSFAKKINLIKRKKD